MIINKQLPVARSKMVYADKAEDLKPAKRQLTENPQNNIALRVGLHDRPLYVVCQSNFPILFISCIIRIVI